MKPTWKRVVKYIGYTILSLFVLAIAGIVLLVYMLFFKKHGSNPDPFNITLYRLAHDPVFTHLPADADPVRPIVLQPAYYQNGLGEGSSQGPTVLVCFNTKLSLEQLYLLINPVAISAGWTPEDIFPTLEYSQSDIFYWDKIVKGKSFSLNLSTPYSVGSNSQYPCDLSANAF